MNAVVEVCANNVLHPLQSVDIGFIDCYVVCRQSEIGIDCLGFPGVIRCIGATATNQQVITTATGQQVIASPTIQRVIRVVADQPVVSRTSPNILNLTNPVHLKLRAITVHVDLGEILNQQREISVNLHAEVGVIHRITTGTTNQRVIALTALQ